MVEHADTGQHHGPKREHRLEIEAINSRREANAGLAPGNPGAEQLPGQLAAVHVKWMSIDDKKKITRGDALYPEAPQPPGAIYDTVGLALSGGGVRSAAFCLGGLQALQAEGHIEKVDYVSTVSGGGYIGASMVAGMSTAGFFPFSYKQHDSKDMMDNPGVRHVRDHSNFLLPRGAMDLMASAAILLRGLVATLAPVLGFILICASLTAILHPDSNSLNAGAVSFLAAWGPATLSIAGALGLLAFVFVWAFPIFPAQMSKGQQEVVNAAPTTFAWWLIIALAAIIFVELQPQILRLFFWLHHRAAQARPDAGAAGLQKWGDAITAAIGVATKFLAPLGALAALFTRQLQGTVKANPSGAGWQALLARVASKALLLWAAAALPVILWAVYLTFSYWAIADLSEHPWKEADWSHSSHLLRTVSRAGGFDETGIKFFLGAAGIALTLFTFFRPANANTLHALYRERLAAAFLFDIRAALSEHSGGRKHAAASWAPGLDPANTDDVSLPPLGPAPHAIRKSDDNTASYIKLSELNDFRAPYLLINTALNIQGSRAVNKRGRNADFFLLSKYWVGSASTGYAPTRQFEQASPGFDLGTAIAVSGAAASSNMGSASIRPLTPTLALLNIRLGYWAKNPRFIADKNAQPRKWPRSFIDRLYLLCEMFSIIDEKSERVYLTDGGHVENLGVYELLRRRCRFIVCIDGECDPGMTFGSLATLQRYARVDLGVRIDNIRWLELRKSGLDAKTGLDDIVARKGPHAVVGDINYPGGPGGKILYVKSSLSGDESDIILDYKRAYGDFPQETTGDQFFSEEQFEAYRALGFHAMYGALSGRDQVAGLVKGWPEDGSPPTAAKNPEVDRRKAIAGLFDGSALA